MKTFLLVLLVAVAAARPEGKKEVVPILRDDRVNSVDGSYSFDTETGDGIKRSEAGESKGDSGAVNTAGDVSFTLPDGQQFYLKFVADEFGYKPESSFLPVAPDYPFPIPQFVLDQIAFAAKEDANRELDQTKGDYVGYD